MPDNIDKTRIERIGDRSFSCSGVDTIPDVMEENIDLRQQIQDMINEALANVTGAVVIQDVPDQITYQFGGGGVTQAQLDAAMSNVFSEMNNLFTTIMKQMWRQFRRIGSRFISIENQINNLQSGTGATKGHALGRHSGGVTIPHNTETIIPINNSSSNPHGWLDTSSGIFTVPYTGLYFVSSAFVFKFVTHHDVHAWTLVNTGQLISTPTVTRPTSAPGDFETSQMQGMIMLSAGQTVTFNAFHTAGGGNTMEITNGDGNHAGIWLIERIE